MFGLSHAFHKLKHKVEHTVHHVFHEVKTHPLTVLGAAGLGYGAYSLLGAGASASSAGATSALGSGATASGLGYTEGTAAGSSILGTLGSTAGTAGSFAVHHPSLLAGAGSLLSATQKPNINIPEANIPEEMLPKPPKPSNLFTNPKPYQGALGGMSNGLFGLTNTNLHTGNIGNNVSFFSLLDDNGVTL